MLKRDNHLAKRNALTLTLTAMCLLLFAAAILVCVFSKIYKDTNAENAAQKGYIIVVEDEITAYEGDERMITPRIVDENGVSQQGRFTYRVLDSAAAPVTVSELGVISVKENAEGTNAEIEVKELNTSTQTKVHVSVVRKLSGVKGVVFGDELVVTTAKQTLTLGDEYSVTVKTIPSQAVLRDGMVSIKTVDRYGKEVSDVLDYEVVEGTTQIKITPKGLGDGTMIFSVVADGKELCKDEKYEFGITMRSRVLHSEVFNDLKNIAESDPVKRERIELISAETLSKLESANVDSTVDSLYGLNKTYFPGLETVVFEGNTVMRFQDETVCEGVCFRVRDDLFQAYVNDEFWQNHSYNLTPYSKNADERWAVFHTFEGLTVYQITDDFSLTGLKFIQTGYENDYFYTGKDPKPQTNAERVALNNAVNAQIKDADLKNGLHIGVGYTPVVYSVKYLVDDRVGVANAFDCVDAREWKYGEKKLLYTAAQIKEAVGKEIGRTGYRFDGWYLSELNQDDVLDLKTEYGNLTDENEAIVTLHAHWTPIQYKIAFKEADGVQDMIVSYDQEFSLAAPNRTGSTFLYYLSGSTIYTTDKTYKNLFDTENTLTLTAQYETNKYIIIFDKSDGAWVEMTTPDSVEVSYSGLLDLGQFQLNSAEGNTEYKWVLMDSAGNQVEGMKFEKDETVSRLSSVNGGRVVLKAFWNPIEYKVVYNFPGFVHNYKDKEDSMLKPAYNTYTQERMFDDRISFISIQPRVGYTIKGWKALYYTEEGSSVQHKLSDRYELGEKKDLVPGASTEESGRTYYLDLIFEANTYLVTFNYDGATTKGVENQSVIYDGTYGTLPVPEKYGETIGSKFLGWALADGTIVTSSTVVQTAGDHTLKAKWELVELKASFKDDPNDLEDIGSSETVTATVSGGSGDYSYSPTSGSGTGYSWSFDTTNLKLTVSVTKNDKKGNITITVTDNVYGTTCELKHHWSSKCIAAGTLITLADGTQKPVEELTGDEMLLVWNFFTGTFDVAPILCIDKDAEATYRVINLSFSDGTSVKVISEHGFFNATLKKFVYLDEDAERYIGHEFHKESLVDGKLVYTTVRLVDVTIKDEVTTTYSPVTYSYLSIYVNGLLSMPGGIDGIFNIFEVDIENMRYDQKSMAEDIARYGTYTYEELYELIPIPEELFEAINAAYLKVAVGKELVTIDGLRALFESYMDLLGIVVAG